MKYQALRHPYQKALAEKHLQNFLRARSLHGYFSQHVVHSGSSQPGLLECCQDFFTRLAFLFIQHDLVRAEANHIAFDHHLAVALQPLQQRVEESRRSAGKKTRPEKFFPRPGDEGIFGVEAFEHGYSTARGSRELIAVDQPERRFRDAFGESNTYGFRRGRFHFALEPACARDDLVQAQTRVGLSQNKFQRAARPPLYEQPEAVLNRLSTAMLRRQVVQNNAAADGDDRRELADDKAVSRKRQNRRA